MLGEKLARQSVTPTSYATETNRFSKTSKAMGSMRMRSSGPWRARGHQIGGLVEAKPEAWGDDGRGFPAGDHRRPFAGGAWREIGPAEERGRHERAPEAGVADAVGLGRRRRCLD